MTTTIEQFEVMKTTIQSGTSVRRTSAFTIMEMMVSAFISVIVIASVASTFMVFAAGSTSVGAYAEMSQQSRKTLELIARDIRSAADVTTATDHEVRIVMPDNDFYSGESVLLAYDEQVGIFSRIERDKNGNEISNRVLLDGVEQFAFGYFDPLGNRLAYDTASLLLSVKSLQIDAEMVREISRSRASDYIISARFMMRNRPVTK